MSHPEKTVRDTVRAALAPSTIVPHPEADYYWREQGLSVYGYESPSNAAPEDLLKLCRKRVLRLGPRWTITPLEADGSFSGAMDRGASGS